MRLFLDWRPATGNDRSTLRDRFSPLSWELLPYDQYVASLPPIADRDYYRRQMLDQNEGGKELLKAKRDIFLLPWALHAFHFESQIYVNYCKWDSTLASLTQDWLAGSALGAERQTARRVGANRHSRYQFSPDNRSAVKHGNTCL